jgi:hypothetical protein
MDPVLNKMLHAQGCTGIVIVFGLMGLYLSLQINVLSFEQDPEPDESSSQPDTVFIHTGCWHGPNIVIVKRLACYELLLLRSILWLDLKIHT